MHGSQSSSAFGRYCMVEGGIRTGVTSNGGRLLLDGSHFGEKRVDAKVTDSPSSEFLILFVEQFFQKNVSRSQCLWTN